MSRVPRSLLAGGAALAVAAGLAACSPAAPATDEELSIRIGLPGFQMPVDWDPASGGYGLWFMSTRPVYEALIKWDTEKHEFVGVLAESFEISDDGLTMSLKLREDVDFTDGEHLDAEGAAAAVTEAFTRENSYWSRADVGEGAMVEVTGEYTFEITTLTPMFDTSLFMSELTYLPIVSPAAIDDPSILQEGPVGTGPYILEEIIPEVSASYVRNPAYRDPDAYDFDTMELRVYDDKVAALNALKSGQIDAAEMDLSLAAEAESAGLVVHTGPSGYISLDILDAQGEVYPELGDVRVRRAIAMAFDRETILEQLEGGYGRVSSQPLDPDSDEYVEGGDDRYPYDPEQARDLLAEAGYPDGFVLRLPLEPGQTTSQAGRYRPVLEQYLSEIGITVEWVQFDNGADIVAGVEAKQVGANLWLNIYPNSLKLASLWLVEDPAWAATFDDSEELTTAAEDYRTGTLDDHDAAQKVLSEFVLDQVFFVPLSHPSQLWVTTPGIEMHLANFPAYFITLDSFSAAE